MAASLIGVLVIQYIVVDRTIRRYQWQVDERIRAALQHVVEDLEELTSERGFITNPEVLALVKLQQDSFVRIETAIEIRDSMAIGKLQHTPLIQSSDLTGDSAVTSDINKHVKSLTVSAVHLPNSTELNLRELVSQHRIDSVLRSHLSATGMNIEHEYHIRGPGIEIMCMSDKPREYRGKKYQVLLFPSQHKGGPVVMELYAFYWQGISAEVVYTIIASSILSLLVFLSFFLALRAMNAQKRLSEVKSDFINNMGHEMKTPLASIGLSASTLLAGKGQGLERYTDIIGEEVGRMNELVDRVLDSARAENGQMLFRPELTDVNNTVYQTINMINSGLNNPSRTVSLSGEISQHIQADPLLLRTAVTNLVENAIKYSTEPVQVILEETDQSIAIRVVDLGIGLDKKEQKRVFDRFYRVPQGNTPVTRGTGLGLYYVQKIADQHNGEIRVSSKKGKGSTFTLIIPKK